MVVLVQWYVRLRSETVTLFKEALASSGGGKKKFPLVLGKFLEINGLTDVVKQAPVLSEFQKLAEDLVSQYLETGKYTTKRRIPRLIDGRKIRKAWTVEEDNILMRERKSGLTCK